MRHLALPFVGALAFAVAATAGCKKNDPDQLLGAGTSGGLCSNGAGGLPSSSTSTAATTGGTTTTGTSGSGGAEVDPVLAKRVYSYTEALRTASLKLVGNVPTLDQIETLKTAPDQAKTYGEMIDAMMNDVRFTKRMIAFWQNTMRMGGPAGNGKPSRDTAPTFAARLTVEKRSFKELFTASTNTCPTFDGTSFVDGSCTNGPETAGILADPGIQAQYFGNLAFRRVRFFQEAFSCKKQPAELVAPTPIGSVGQYTYTSPWKFESIAGKDNGGRIDFHNVGSDAICANCHTTSNHRAPLFANFDEAGVWQPAIQVQVPLSPLTVALPGDWLPPGETTAWKYKVPVNNLTELGAAMANDSDVMACAVIRVWNFAMSKGDVVNDAATLPEEVYSPLVKSFEQSGYLLRDVVRTAFTHDDFVKF